MQLSPDGGGGGGGTGFAVHSDQLATILSQRFQRDVTFAVSSHGSMVVDEDIIRPVTASRRLYGAHEAMNSHLDSHFDSTADISNS